MTMGPMFRKSCFEVPRDQRCLACQRRLQCLVFCSPSASAIPVVDKARHAITRYSEPVGHSNRIGNAADFCVVRHVERFARPQ